MNQPQHLSTQLEGMERLLDADTGAILFRHPTLRGIPDLVLESVHIRNPAALARLLAEPFKAQLPVAV